jgi:hypothetical protein
MSGPGKWQLSEGEDRLVLRPELLSGWPRLVAITRVRNEELILGDSLDHVGAFADAIVCLDDASSDTTLETLCRHPKVAVVLRNRVWQAGEKARLLAETRHRGLLLEEVRRAAPQAWIYCFDADERVVGDVGAQIELAEQQGVRALRVRLFDAYLTEDDCDPFQSAASLVGFRRWFGPERRDIIMFWKNSEAVSFVGLDAREPAGADAAVSDLLCQHYGKSLSVAHWEQTCDYYVSNFPEEPYGRKWRERKGKAIHAKSDFGRPLYPWGCALFDNAVVIHP